MKVLLTGSTGQVGQEIINSKPPNIKIINPLRKELDLSDFKSCEKIVITERPDWVINCGAFTSVESAEQNIELAKKINSYAPQAFTRALNKINGNLLQLSSDFVFDGSKNIPYNEHDYKNPICHYGYTKSLGENLIQKTIENLENATILRTSWVISSRRDNFLLKMLKLHNEKKIINVVSDQFGAPTSAKYLAKACWKLIELKKTKKIPYIIHWTDYGITSWNELAMAIGDIAFDLGIIKKKAIINPIKSNEYSSVLKRPKYSVLDIKRSSKYLKLKPNHWRNNLEEILKELREKGSYQ